MDLASLTDGPRSGIASPGQPQAPAAQRANMSPDPFMSGVGRAQVIDLAQQTASLDPSANQQVPALFSPLFQCQTTLAFYAALLAELQAMAALVDPCPSIVREIIWEQVFLLIGVHPHRCDTHLKPIIEAWLSAPTVNLLAVELLYIAFVRALANHPDLLRAQGPPPMRAHQQSQVQQHHFPAPTAHQQAQQPQQPQQMQQQQHQQLQAPISFVSRPVKRETPLPQQQRFKTHATATSNTDPDAGTNLLNSRFLTPPNSNPVTATEVYFLLRVWAPQLDAMPREARDALHTLLRAHPAFASIHDLPPFSQMTAAWAAEPLKNFEAAALLFLAVGFLKALNKISCDCFDPRRMLPVFNPGDDLLNLSFKKYVSLSQHEVE